VIESRGSSATWIATLGTAALSLALLGPAPRAFADPEPASPSESSGSSLRRSAKTRPHARVADEATLTEAARLDVEAAIAAETDLPASEQRLDAALGTIPAFDHDARAFGTADGRVCILALDDFTLRSRHSANGGGVFGTEVVVAGGAGQPAVKQYAARRGADGSVYVGLLVADLSGGVGLHFVRSDDTCQTWNTPLAIVAFGNATHGVRSVAIATGASGVAAIIYRGDLGFDPYVVATTNSGGSWTTPVRVDAGVAVRTFASVAVDIAIEPTSGTIHAVYSQDRGSGSSIWRARSTDGGLSFSVEVSFDSILGSGQADSLHPDVEVASDGSILVAFWDSIGTDRIYVVRSIDGGTVYTNVLNLALGGTNISTAPVVATATGTSTVLVLWVNHLKELRVARSATNGSAFDAPLALVATAAGSPVGILEHTQIAVTRTAAGNWAVGWSDDRSDTYAGMKTDVFVRSSSNDGVTWDTEQRVDSDAAGAAPSPIADLVANGADALFVLFQDRRANGGRSADLYVNRSTTASPLAFGTDARADADSTTISVDVNLDPVVTTDGASRVYVAFSAFSTGPESDIYVAASANGGYSFATPVRASAGTAGSIVRVLPRVRALTDGRVYLAYVADNASGQREIRFNRSTDFGATWSATDILLGTVASPQPGYYSFFDRPALQLEALADGTVYVAWSTQTNILLARSLDFGANFFTAADVDQDTRGFNRAPRLCAAGNSLLLVWEGADLAFAFTSVWAVASTDRAATWGTPVQLRPEGLAGGVALPAVACDGAGGAVAVWPDFRSVATLQLFANRFDGATWGGETVVITPGGLDASLPVVALSGASNVVVTYMGSGGGIYASRSTDGGSTFPSFQRLDSAMSQPAAISTQPRICADGGTNMWISWLDESAGLPMLVSRRSPDGGANWDSPLRVDRDLPNGGSSSFYFQYEAATPATLAGAAFFTWAAERDSFLADVLFNVHDIDDSDRDGLTTPGDCNDSDATLLTAPATVAGFRVAKAAGLARLSWTSQSATAGSSTVSDVATGLLSALRSTGTFSAATCLADGIAGTTFDDPGVNPPAGEGRWYLLRMTNGCGTGSFGNSSLVVDPRDALDSGTTCD